MKIARASADEVLEVQGFAKRLEGERMSYESPEPDVDRALLVRSLDARWSIAWESASIPKNPEKKDVVFTWIFGINARAERRRFELMLGDRTLVRFRNPSDLSKKDWTLRGVDGVQLRFRVTHVDRHLDGFGYAALRVPASLVSGMEHARFRVRGETAGSRIWYMTFEAQVRERCIVTPLPAILRTKKGPKQAARLGIVHLGEPCTARVAMEDGRLVEVPVDYGWNERMLALEPSERKRAGSLSVDVSGEKRVIRYEQTPVRKMTIDLVQHTHTDIGYTRPQTEILPEHLRFIDYALDYCDATDEYPDDAKFRWTCEASWPVREYLRSRPKSQVARLLRRVKEGRIEVTGMLFNLSEILPESLYPAFLAPVDEFRARGMQVTTAMQNDVNGAALCLIDLFKKKGIRYLTMGEHGHRAKIPFDRPTAFWWKAPSGNRVLAFRAEHYNTGNFWGLHTGRIRTVERELFRYLPDLYAKEYPWDRLMIQYSGAMTDNSAPAKHECDLIRSWNEKYEWPRLRTAVARDYLAWVEEEHGEQLEEHALAWPDWWTDGFGSAARETAAARLAAGRFRAVKGLFTIDSLLGAGLPESYRERTEAVADAIAFYAEHTFGADESIRNPDGESNQVQWAEKAAYVWTAVKDCALLEEQAMGRLFPLLPSSETAMLVLVNTTAHARSGSVEIYVDHEVLPPGGAFTLVGAQGERAHAERIKSRSDGSYWRIFVRDLPAFGYACYAVQPGKAESFPAVKTGDLVLENQWYRLHVDPRSGAIAELFDKELEQQLVDPKAPFAFGTMIHETLENREQLEQFRLDAFARKGWEAQKVERLPASVLSDAIRVRASLAACAKDPLPELEVHLMRHQKRIELRYRIRKLRDASPESLYVAMPFQLPGSELFYEVQGAMVRPDRELLPRTSSDWQCVQGLVRIASGRGQILLAAPELPLMQFGGIQLGKFADRLKLERPHVYSWVMNNYWTTNFQALQGGDLSFRYVLRTVAKSGLAEAARFGQEERVPILARMLSAGKRSDSAPQRLALLELPGSLQLVDARPGKGGATLLLRERGGVALRGAALRGAGGVQARSHGALRPFGLTELELAGRR